MPSYRWVCHVCEMVNAPELVICSKCGFPANASGVEIEAVLKNLPKSTPPQAIYLTKSQKIIGIIGFCMAGVGAFMGRFGSNFKYTIIGFALMAVGLCVLWSIGVIGEKRPNPSIKRDWRK